MTPLDDAHQHCAWAKRAGICPRHVILAADGPVGQGEATWLQAVQFLAGASTWPTRHPGPQEVCRG